jgi:hypothetical protein
MRSHSAVRVDNAQRPASRWSVAWEEGLERDDLVWVHIAPNEVHSNTTLRDVGRSRPKLSGLIRLGNDHSYKRVECKTRGSPYVRVQTRGWCLSHCFPRNCHDLNTDRNERSALSRLFRFVDPLLRRPVGRRLRALHRGLCIRKIRCSAWSRRALVRRVHWGRPA